MTYDVKVWNRMISFLPKFVGFIQEIETSGLDIPQKKVAIERLLLRANYHRLKFPEDDIVTHQLFSSFSSRFWYPILVDLSISLSTIGVLCRYFRKFKVFPRDLVRFYIDSVAQSDEVECHNAIFKRIKLLDRYRLVDLNGDFYDAIPQPNGDLLYLSLPYVVFLATVKLYNPLHVYLFLELVHYISIEFGIEIDLVRDNILNMLPTQEMRDCLISMSLITLLHTSDSFVEREIRIETKRVKLDIIPRLSNVLSPSAA